VLRSPGFQLSTFNVQLGISAAAGGGVGWSGGRGFELFWGKCRNRVWRPVIVEKRRFFCRFVNPNLPHMNEATKRLLLRAIHLVFSIPVIGYCYSPFEKLPDYAHVVRYAAIPALAVSGLWMWKRHSVARLIGKRAA
jgi:hypothetical protein